MTYYADLTPYTYATGKPGADDDRPALSVGWLDAEHEFDRGDVSKDLVDELLRWCTERRINVMRGWHPCLLCQAEYPVRVQLSERSMALGDAEIRIVGSDGTTFAAPNLVYHYVASHRYRPPQEFLDALGARK